MLPQGRFQAFLRASSAERHAVLQRLFRTRRFEEVERWLVERRIDAPPRAASRTTTRSPAWSTGSGGGRGRPSRRLGRRTTSTGRPTTAPSSPGPPRSRRMPSSGHLQRDDARRRGPGAGRRDRGPRRRAPAPRARGSGTRAALAAHRRTRGHRRRGRSRPSAPARAHRRAAPVLPLARVAERSAGARERARTDATPRPSPGGGAAGDRAGRASSRRGSQSAPATPTEARAVAESWLPRERELAETTTRLTAVRAAPPPARRRARPRSADLAAPAPTAGRRRSRCCWRPQRAQAERSSEAGPSWPSWPGGSRRRHDEELEREVGESAELLDERRHETMRLRSATSTCASAGSPGWPPSWPAALAVGGSCPVCGSRTTTPPARRHRRPARRPRQTSTCASEAADFERRRSPGAGDDAEAPAPGRLARAARSPVTPLAEQVRAARDAAPRCESPPPRRALPGRPARARADRPRRRGPGRCESWPGWTPISEGPTEQRVAAASTVTALTSRLYRPARGRDAVPRRGSSGTAERAARRSRRRAPPWSSRSAPPHAAAGSRGRRGSRGRAGFTDVAEALAAVLDDEATAAVDGRAAARDVASRGRGRAARGARPRRAGRRGARPAGASWRRATTPPSRTPPHERRTRPPLGRRERLERAGRGARAGARGLGAGARRPRPRPPAGRAGRRARAPTTSCRCGSRRTSSPSGCARSWPPPTNGSAR